MRAVYLTTVALSVVCFALALVSFLNIPFTKVPTEQSLATIEGVAAKARMAPKDLAIVKVLVRGFGAMMNCSGRISMG